MVFPGLVQDWLTWTYSVSCRFDWLLCRFWSHYGENGRKGQADVGVFQRPERDHYEARRRNYVVSASPPQASVHIQRRCRTTCFSYIGNINNPPAVAYQPDHEHILCLSSGTPPLVLPASSVERSSPLMTWRWWRGSWGCIWSLW